MIKINYIKIDVYGIVDLEGLEEFKHSFIIETKDMKKILKIINKKFGYNFKWRKLREKMKTKKGGKIK